MGATQEFENTIVILIQHWTVQKIQLNQGLSIELVKKLERDFDFVFEDSFYTYLKKVDGFKKFESDEAWFSFWSSTRMKEENEGSHPRNVIWFLDHSLNLCCFGFHRENKNIYTRYENSDDLVFVADSFSEFINLYLKDPYLLLR